MSEVVLLLAGGFGLGFVLSFLFADTSHVLRKLLALGLAPASAVGWFLVRDPTDLQGLAHLAIIAVVAAIFFVGYACAVLLALAVHRRGREASAPPLASSRR